MREIIKKYKNNVRKIIKNFTGAYNEDIEQEVYIKTWKRLDDYSEQNKFASWIGAITSNTCKDFLKSSQNKIKNDSEDEILLGVQTADNIEQNYENKERRKKILKEIERLPKKLKEVIICLEFENKSYEEISIIINKPIGTVKSRIHAAREILREKLKDLM